jgi:DNA-binding NarL/FixJ family response regulator
MKVLISSRELEILRKSADGLTVKEIANELKESQQMITRSQKEILDRTGEVNVLKALQALAKRGFELKDENRE